MTRKIIDFAALVSLLALLATNAHAQQTVNGQPVVPASQITGTLSVANGGLNTSTAPTSAQIPVASGTSAYVPKTVSGDCTLATTGAITCTKTNGSNFVASATTDTTSASNISSGTLAAARGGAGTVTGALKGNGAGVVSQAATTDMSDVSKPSWVPTPAGSTGAGTPTCGTKTGNTSMLGDLVFVQWALACTATTGMTGNLTIVTLPRAVAAGTLAVCSIFEADGITYSTNYTWLSAYAIPTGGGTTIRIAQNGSAQSELDLPMSGVASSFQLYGACTYKGV